MSVEKMKSKWKRSERENAPLRVLRKRSSKRKSKNLRKVLRQARCNEVVQIEKSLEKRWRGISALCFQRKTAENSGKQQKHGIETPRYRV